MGSPRPATKALNALIKEALATGISTAHVDNGVDTVVIGSGNAKVGPSFTIPDGVTCPGKTSACSNVCYLQFGAFMFPAARNSRQRNYAHLLDAYHAGGVPQVANELYYAIINSRAVKTNSLRIHDGGDFFAPWYVEAWIMVAERLYRTHRDIRMWAYTRSWTVRGALADALKRLAAAPNIQLWASADRDNWEYLDNSIFTGQYAGVAFMHLSGDEGIVKQLSKELPSSRLVIFPQHANGGEVKTDIVDDAPNCPAILGTIKESKANPACLACKKCL